MLSKIIDRLLAQARKILFDETMQAWEEPSDYEARMLAVEEFKKRGVFYPTSVYTPG